MAELSLLLADDEQAFLDRFVGAFESAGIRTITAKNVEEIFSVLEEHGKTIDVALIDINMPAGNFERTNALGVVVAATKLILRNYSHLEVFGMSNERQPEVAGWFERNCAGFLPKRDLFEDFSPSLEILKGEKKGQLTIFISHRHADRAIADVFRQTIEDKWSIRPRVRAFQSSNVAGDHAPRVGEPLTRELKTALANADVVLLIYTNSDEDWSYCMWECGVATNPESEDTRVIVFQCGEDFPAVFESCTRLKYTEEGTRRFADDFHRMSDFFRRRPAPYNPDIADNMLELLSNQLNEELKAVVPTALSPQNPMRRWHYLQLSLSLSEEEVIAFEKAVKADEDNARTNAVSTLEQKCIVVKASKEALSHFDLADLDQQELSLHDVYMSWKDKTEFGQFDWFSDVCDQLIRVISRKPAEEVLVPLKSVRGEHWYLPTVNRVVANVQKRNWTFYLELYRIPAKGKFINIATGAEAKSGRRNQK